MSTISLNGIYKERDGSNLLALLSDLAVTDADPITLYQENKSTIIMAAQHPNFKRAKHMIIREAFVKEQIVKRNVVLKYLPTEEMPADMLTKPLSEPCLSRHLETLHVRNL